MRLELGLCFTQLYFLTLKKGITMKTNLKTLLVIGALVMPLSTFAAEGDPVSTKLGDAVITTKVKAEFAKDKAVSASDIKVETDSNGLVQLSGTAKTQAEADQAVKIAKNIKGVTGVKSDIVVQ
jgi:hyperosmotically inducible protein